MLIVFSGAHGTGKTYHVDRLSNKYNTLRIKESARLCPYPINGNSIEAQRWMFWRQLHMECKMKMPEYENKVVLLDRCTIDTIVYSDYYGMKDEFDKFVDVDRLMNLYEKIYWLRTTYFYVDDGVRDSKQMQVEIDSVFEKYYADRDKVMEIRNDSDIRKMEEELHEYVTKRGVTDERFDLQNNNR